PDDVVGLSLRRLRQERHLRLVDVATAAQVSTSFLSDVECGKRQLLLIRLPALARALGVHPLDLLVFPTFPPWCPCQKHERDTASDTLSPHYSPRRPGGALSPWSYGMRSPLRPGAMPWRAPPAGTRGPRPPLQRQARRQQHPSRAQRSRVTMRSRIRT